MREELDKKLCEKYPGLFRNRNGSPSETLMCWGFDCDDGWYDIIDSLCAVIDNQVKNNHRNVESYERFMENRESAAQGDFSFLFDNYWTQEWYDNNLGALECRKQQFLDPLPECHHWKTPPVKMEYPVVAQVKEKFGTLRFYCDNTDAYMDGAISMAESLSAKTCEVCGDYGHARGGGWIRTLCDWHAAKYDYMDTEENNL